MARRKVLVTLDEALVERLDRAAHERGLTRSALIATLADRDLRRSAAEARQIEESLESMRRLGARLGTGDEDVVGLVRRMRDERSEQLAGR